jgi:hypothetical protein
MLCSFFLCRAMSSTCCWGACAPMQRSTTETIGCRWAGGVSGVVECVCVWVGGRAGVLCCATGLHVGMPAAATPCVSPLPSSFVWQCDNLPARLAAPCCPHCCSALPAASGALWISRQRSRLTTTASGAAACSGACLSVCLPAFFVFSFFLPLFHSLTGPSCSETSTCPLLAACKHIPLFALLAPPNPPCPQASLHQLPDAAVQE